MLFPPVGGMKPNLCVYFLPDITNETEQTHYTSRSCDIIHVRLLIQLPHSDAGCTYHFG